MKLMLLFFISVFPAIILGTKCLQCSHSDKNPNEGCIEGKYPARKCPTAENSCFISLLTNVSADNSLLKFSRQCALEKKEEEMCEVKHKMLQCYCNGDGCNIIPAKLLIVDKIKTNDNSGAMELDESDTFVRKSRVAKDGICDPAKTPPTDCDSVDLECIDDADSTTTPKEKKCRASAATGDKCYQLVVLPSCLDAKDECIDTATQGTPSQLECQERIDATPDYVEPTTQETTPVQFYEGKQTWATYFQERKECWNNSVMAQIIRGSQPPEKKRRILEDNGCRLEYGLECRNISDDSANPPTFHQACRCMLSLGNDPAIANPADPNSGDEDTKFGVRSQCYIPVARGSNSECFASPPTLTKSKKIVDENRLPPYETFGWPLPFGDPQGIGPDPPHLLDTFNGNTAEEHEVAYVPWNTIYGRCPPHAECREAATYLGKRCQCFKNATLLKGGLCNFSNKISAGLAGCVLAILLLTIL